MNDTAQGKMNEEPSDEDILYRKLDIALMRYVSGVSNVNEFMSAFKKAHKSGYRAVCETYLETMIKINDEKYYAGEKSASEFCDGILEFVKLGYKVIPSRHIRLLFDAEYKRNFNADKQEMRACLDCIIDKTNEAGLPELAKILDARKDVILGYREDRA